MQTSLFRRSLGATCLAVGLLAACTNANDPYAKIKDGPLVSATLHTVTLVTDSPGLAEQLGKDGYAPLAMAPNYQAAIHVESLFWNVPDEVAGKVAVFKGAAGAPDLRVLVMPLPPAAPPADAGVLKSFYRNVLGTEVPQWPQKVARADDVRVHVLTFLIADVLDANRKLRAHTIPVMSEPVGITTSYLGDEKTMTIRAPDGAIIELVQAAAQ